MRYIWEDPDWPKLHWDVSALIPLLTRVAKAQGLVQGRMEALGFDLQREAELGVLTEDVIRSSQIEGENLPRDQVRSSVARRLGMDAAGVVASRDVEGVVEMHLDAAQNYQSPVDAERLFGWHAALFPTGRSGMHRIVTGGWRDNSNGPMRVVSGPIGRERVHFEAPPATQVPAEMQSFLDWVEAPKAVDSMLAAGLAHLRFVTIHPFEDGNGRIGRALADLMLTRAEGGGQRYYSMSDQICRERNDYYDMLERTQKGDLDITRWQEWFLSCLLRAIERADELVGGVLARARFWQRLAEAPLNKRQIKVLNRLFEGFEGKLTSTNWARLAKCSQDTAQRDINDLIQRGALKKDPGGGRSTSYSLILT